MSLNLQQLGASPMAVAGTRTSPPIFGQIRLCPNSVKISNYNCGTVFPIRLAVSTRPKINSFTCFAVPKKRTSASKKRIRKNIWKRKGDQAALKAFSLGKSLSTGNSSTLMLQQSTTLTPELKTTLDKVVNSQKIVLFMKGTKDFPQCGFSNTVVQILKTLNAPFDTINILENEMLRVGLKEYSNWPTFPQLYIDGEFFGGCDITVDAYKSGELQELVEKSMCS